MSESKSEERLKLIIFSVVTGVWAFTFLFDAFDGRFDMPVTVHLLMTAIIGYFVGSRLRSKKDSTDKHP